MDAYRPAFRWGAYGAMVAKRQNDEVRRVIEHGACCFAATRCLWLKPTAELVPWVWEGSLCHILYRMGRCLQQQPGREEYLKSLELGETISYKKA